jgi:hypothetical protein
MSFSIKAMKHGELIHRRKTADAALKSSGDVASRLL